MFDIGFAEILLLSLIGLLVLGPERLPRVARTLGGLSRKARSSWMNLKRSIDAELNAEDLKEPLKAFQNEIKSTVADVESTIDDVKTSVDDVTSTVDDLKSTFKPAQPAATGNNDDSAGTSDADAIDDGGGDGDRGNDVDDGR
jgi:sec-independent protein translocase protein TatB